jgi:hypothetical protein
LVDGSAIIVALITKEMNKSKALQAAQANGLSSLSNTNTIFSNIIQVQKGWWLQPSNNKFKRDLYLILNDDKVRKLYIFKLPANTITHPSSCFKQRNDQYRTDCSDIYIPTSGISFKEKNGFDFSKFKTATIDY